MLSKSDRENGLARSLKTYLVSLIKRDRRKREKGGERGRRVVRVEGILKVPCVRNFK
jgi:hypothetical protein